MNTFKNTKQHIKTEEIIYIIFFFQNKSNMNV